MKNYGGTVIFLDRDNINTDEIIPAKYLTVIEKSQIKNYLFEDLKLDGFDPSKIKWNEYNVIVTRSNFGCGSSREMAISALEVNNINVIVASNFARIFRENAFNDGVLALELNPNIIKDLFESYFNKQKVTLSVDLEKQILRFSDGSTKKAIPFSLTPFQKELIHAGGWVELANRKY